MRGGSNVNLLTNNYRVNGDGIQYFLNPSIEETIFFHSDWNTHKILTIDLLKNKIHLTNDSEGFTNGYSTFRLTPSSIENILSGDLLKV